MSALEALHTRGAHFVLCRGDKQPLAVGWQKTRPGLAVVEAHAEAGGLVGVIPASLGCVVVDVDEGSDRLESRRCYRGVLDAEPIVTVGTQERRLPSVVSGPGR